MHLSRFAVACLLAWSIDLPDASARGGRLAAARSEVAGGDSDSRERDRSRDRGDDRSRGGETHRHHHHHHHHTSHHAHYWPYVAPSYFQCVYECEPEVVEPPPPRYASYPYASSRSPYLLEADLHIPATASTSDPDARVYVEQADGRRWAGQLMLDAGYLNGVAHGTLDARVLMPGATEVSFHHQQMFEPSVRDHNAYGGVAFGARLLQSSHLLIRGYAGLVYFGVLDALDLGLELGLGFDAFIVRPLVLSARIGGAAVGDAVLPQARVQLGYLFGRFELFAGYQHFYVGSVSLSAPFLGTRVWL